MPKGDNNKLTTKQFINRAQKTHGNKYDYSKVNYKNTSIEVCIICPEHGEFNQKPINHISGKGCTPCGYKKVSNRLKQSFGEWLIKAKQIHGNTYDYSKVNYVNNKTKIEIICSTHGSFWQKPLSHLNGREPSQQNKKRTGCGCPKCFGKNKLSKEEFIRRSKEIHGDKYDYSKVVYTNNKAKVKIKCPKHGYFFQVAKDHFDGRGCSKCFTRLNEERINKFLTNLNIEFYRNYSVKLPDFAFPVRVDFYIPKLNLFIEYNGEQHYHPVCFGSQSLESSKANFEKQKRRDKALRIFCKDQDINLLEIDGRKFVHQKLIDFLHEYFNDEKTK